ncbi:MAG TPA: hypothetical protein V6C98_07375 [Thermosynechococcaceae cyanobacterium]
MFISSPAPIIAIQAMVMAIAVAPIEVCSIVALSGWQYCHSDAYACLIGQQL